MRIQSEKLRHLATNGPIQIAGVINTYCALLAARAGFKAIYLSGGGVAACNGLPDLGINTLDDVIVQTDKITEICELPLLVDADTGFGNLLLTGRTVRALIKAGAAGMHLEDQLTNKRCGHLAGKQLCSSKQMCDRIKVACDSRDESGFVVMARTDALAVEGMEQALERCCNYAEAGADMLFFEGATEVEQYAKIATATGLPVLANITEFGVTPLWTLPQLAEQQVALILYPLTAFRAMMKAAEECYSQLAADGGQQNLMDKLQTREELYERLDYAGWEQRITDKQ